MVLQEGDEALIKAESLGMGKHGGIKKYAGDKKNTDVYIFDMRLDL